MDTQYAVTLVKTRWNSNELILTTIDSAANFGETVVKVPFSKNGEIQIGHKKDEPCLGNKYCYSLAL